MFKKILTHIKILYFEKKILDIDDELSNYHFTLKLRNIRLFGGQLNIEKDFRMFEKNKLQEKQKLLGKIKLLKSSL